MEYYPLKRLPKHALYAVSLTVLAVPVMAADNNNPALKALFEQATYWHEKAHDELAQGALQKILLIDKNNTEALYLLALYAQQEGNKAEAERWRKKLGTVAPDDPRSQALNNSGTAHEISQSQLSQARNYAAKGDFARAIASYQSIFNGKKPIDSLATEYYLTLASSPTGKQEAIDGLKQRLSMVPNDEYTRLALGKVMTYQESTRREGINLLAELAPDNDNADQAWRQALLWLMPKLTDKPLYVTYQQRHPTDKKVSDYFERNIEGEEKRVGFMALNKNDLSAAKSQFENILANNPNDGDALAGMGFIAMRSGDFSRAESYLSQAAKQGGSHSAQWSALAQDATFYGTLEKAKQMATAGKLDDALTLSAPLTKADGDKGNSVMLFRADVFRRKGDLPQAEQAYRSLLAQNAQNNDAKLGLYYLLHQQRDKRKDAEKILQSIPVNLRPRFTQTSGGINVAPQRREAALAMQSNDASRALSILQQALDKQPSNPWVRLDMALIHHKKGDEVQAQRLISPLMLVGAPVDNLYAAALFAAETSNWMSATALMARIPVSKQTHDMRKLVAKASVNQQRVNAENYLRQGNTSSAAVILRQLAQKPPSDPADLGALAKDLMSVGDLSTAVQLVRDNMRQGVKGNAGDYAAQLAVLNQAGLSREADAWLSDPALQAKSSSKDISQLRIGSVVNEADQLRLRGQYSEAYDRLVVALQGDPQNAGLMLAMGRLYQSGQMNKEAGQVYNYLLSRNSQDQEAREGAVWVALAQGEVSRARQLLKGLPGSKTAEQLLLSAHVAEADGDYRQALALLRAAKSQLSGVTVSDSSGHAMVGGLQLADNPFADQPTVPSSLSSTPSAYGEVLPWQIAQADRPGSVGGIRTVVTLAKNTTLQKIEELMDQVQGKTATWVQGDVLLRNNSSGEKGLSSITAVKGPISLSGMPMDIGRLSVDVTPVMLKAGTPTNIANSRFGLGALQQAQEVAAATQASIIAAQNSAAAAQEADLNYQEIHATRDQVCSISPDSTDCDTATIAQAQAYAAKQLADSLITRPQTFNPDDFYADSPGKQEASGLELALALSGDSYKLDAGTTPLGTGVNSVVGGVQWSPKMTENSTLSITVERRAVMDSLLSYVGAEDAISGKKWGAVTKSGGGLNVSYDNGNAGMYAGAGYYAYLGENVTNNKAVNAILGAYLRPYKDKENELKVGVNINYLNFQKNLSYFSYGQGGYFSPHNYAALSFPIEFTQKTRDFSYTLSGNVGYQSYKNQESPYFPSDPALQTQLESLVSQGYGKQATYAAQDKNGISFNLKADGHYKITPTMLVGGQLGYDTFGSYSESTAKLYFRYSLNGQ